MANKRPQYIYPEYLQQILNHLMECSISEKYPLLYEKADLIAVLYNQYNDFPITDQVYNFIWIWANKMLEAGSTNWMKEYWSHANQYYTFKLENKGNAAVKSRFREFHVMMGALLTYKRQFEQLRYVMEFTNSLPAKYPLIPSTFKQILEVYEDLSSKNQMMYLLNYRMMGMYTGAGEENRIEGTLIDYLALLLIRLHAVNDYNITFDNPLALPPVGKTVEDNERKIVVAETFKNRIRQWQLDPEILKECGLSLEGVRKAIDLLDQYMIACRGKQIEIPKHPVVSEHKKKKLKADLISSVRTCKMWLPFVGLADEGGELFPSSQEVLLDPRLILEGYDDIASNLGEAIINAIYTQLRQFYCFQFLINSPCVSYTVPYRDMGTAMKRLSLKNGFCILALGISSHFFDETDGFVRADDGSVKYGQIDVINIPANNECLLIMKKKDVPKVVIRPITEGRQREYAQEREIDEEKRLYSNVDSLAPDNLTLTTSMTFGIILPVKMKYVRIRIAYQLVSDDMLIRSIEPVNKFIV